MFSLLNDDDYPKIRKSLMMCLALIFLVSNYGIGIRFPQSLFDLPEQVIEPEATLTALWLLSVYLIWRYSSHYRANRIRYRARLDHNAEFAAQAEHYKNEIQELKVQVEKKVAILEKALQPYENFPVAADAVNLDFSELVKEFKRVMLAARDDEKAALAVEINDGMDGLIEQTRLMRGEFERQVEFQKQRLKEIETGKPQFQELLAQPAITHFDQQADAETVSGEILGWDQFVTSSAAVAVLLVTAAWSTVLFIWP